jgi:putative aminopeptidase FrvX
LPIVSKKDARTTSFHISNYEEVGHGAATAIPADARELLALVVEYLLSNYG